MDLKLKVVDLKSAFGRLKESYELAQSNEEFYTFFRDSTVQRFEFTVEILWETIKTYLKQMEGIDCKSPKGCIKDFFSVGYLNENEVKIFLEMIDDRNMTSHTYHEEVAEKIFQDLKFYLPLIEKIIFILEEKNV